MDIKVLGSGCPKCQALERTVREAAAELGVRAEIEKVTDMRGIMQYPILSTPGLVINEKLVSSGKVPGKPEVAAFLRAAEAGR